MRRTQTCLKIQMNNEKGNPMETQFDRIEQVHRSLARERVLTDLRTLCRDSEDLLRATAEDMSDKANEARSRLSAALERAKSTCAQVQVDTLATATAAAKRADTVMRDHPYESLGIALGVGLVIGALVTRR